MNFYLARIARPAVFLSSVVNPIGINYGPGQAPAVPGEVISAFTFMANLAAQETTGDAVVSTSPQRVYERLAGTRELDAILYAVADSPIPESELGRDEVGAVIIPAEGESPEVDLVGFLYIGLPLLEDTAIADLECVLDVEYLPLPGERPSLAARELAHWLVEQGVTACRAQGRTRVLAGIQSTTADCEDDPFAHALDVHGFTLKNSEAQARLSLDQLFLDPHSWHFVSQPAAPEVLQPRWHSENWRGAKLGAHTDAVLRLLQIAEADMNTGNLVADDVEWNLRRLHEVRADTVRVGLFQAAELVGLAEASRQPGADPRMAELTCVVIDRRFRGQGWSYVLLQALFAAVPKHWPDVKDLYTSWCLGDDVVGKISKRLGAQIISYSQTFELE